MGLPAVVMTTRTRSSRSRLHLAASPARRRRRSSRRLDASSELFALCCVVFAGVALFGLGRVMLAARATEACIRAAELRQDIKSERLAGDMLEIDRSVLTVPSRIESIAGGTMEMAAADCIEYMALPAARTTEPDDQALSNEDYSAGSRSAFAEDPNGVVASLLRMAAGEAQVLLVGDVGIASPE